MFVKKIAAQNKNIPGNSPDHTDKREALNEIKCWLSKHTKSNQTNANYTAICDKNQNSNANSGKKNTSQTKPTQKSATDSDGEDSFVHVGANFTAYMTKNMVNVSINGTKSKAICDTDSPVSCMSKQFFEKAFPEQKPNINPCQIKSLVGVGGTHHPVLGVIQIEVKFGTLGLVYPFYIIKDLHHSIIIGHDFMETHNVTLDIKDRKMIIQDHIKVCTLQTNTGYARTVKPVTLPANPEVDIQVKLARVATDEEVLLEPLSKLTNINIMGTKCLIYVNKGRSVMRLVNPADKDIHLRGNGVLAVVAQVKKAQIFTLNESKTDSSQATLQPNANATSPKFTFILDNDDLNEQ